MIYYIYEVSRGERYTFILKENGADDPRFKREDGWSYKLIRSLSGSSAQEAFYKLIRFEESFSGGLFFRS